MSARSSSTHMPHTRGPFTFAITGTLDVPRTQAIAQIGRAGHRFATTMTNEVDYLVVGRPIRTRGDDSRKLAKAKAVGARVINEAQLFKLLGGHAIRPRVANRRLHYASPQSPKLTSTTSSSSMSSRIKSSSTTKRSSSAALKHSRVGSHAKYGPGQLYKFVCNAQGCKLVPVRMSSRY